MQPSRISDYGLVGNCRTAALISRTGSVDWFCPPHFDSPSVFAAMLDPARGGHFSITPAGEFTSHQSYVFNTNVLETTMRCSDGGECRILDCFSVTSEEEKKRELWPNVELLRVVEGIRGNLKLRVEYVPRPGYGRLGLRLVQRRKLGLTARYGENLLVLHSDVAEVLQNRTDFTLHADGTASMEFVISAGKRVLFSLVYSGEAPAVIPPLGASADHRLNLTIDYWRKWILKCRYTGPYKKWVDRSALALKLLIFAPSGAVVAAPTTSLPEEIGGVRNWDYRYCWLRDASLTIRALMRIGYTEEAYAFLSWLIHTTRLTHPRLQVLYSVYGRTEAKESNLGWLDGYANSKPVRVGNGAAEQFQLDIYGEVINSIFQLAVNCRDIDRDTRNLALGIAKETLQLWTSPDCGIWEVRSHLAHHTHSKVLAWVALDRTIKMARHYGWKLSLPEYQNASARIRQAIETFGYDKNIGAYTAVFGAPLLDASLLRLPMVGYCSAASHRMQSTSWAIHQRLSKNGFLFRYKDKDDGIQDKHKGEGSFGICNFWLAENMARAGHATEASAWMNAILETGNGTWLWPEEIDPDTREFLGNYPQAFTHIGLINAAISIAQTQAKPEKAA